MTGPAGAPGEPGPQGDQGPPGSGGDKYYRHQQLIPAAVWSIPHGLGKRPAIEAEDSAGTSMDWDDRVDDDLTHTTLTFPAATGGEAICN